MNYRIVADSSSDMFVYDKAELVSVPLKIITDQKEYTDNRELDVGEMLCDLEKYKGRSSSSCPNVDDWLRAFGDAECVFCVTITSGLSGSYNCARSAATQYVYDYPQRKAYVIDTLSVGPEAALIVEKLGELIESGNSFEEIVEAINEYKRRTHLIFALESMRNLANNGRVKPIVAKLAGVLDIRAVGRASEEGVLDVFAKPRGAYRTLLTILDEMKSKGYDGGKVRIHHCENEGAAKVLAKEIKKLYVGADVKIRKTKALCSFYAERGGLLVGFEDNSAVNRGL